MIQVQKYQQAQKSVWNSFVSKSKNATFLFFRDFMEYHSDRFTDFSLIIFKDEKPVALLPANIQNEILYSHQGLSYGGLVLEKTATFEETASIFKAILKFLEKEKIKKLHLKLLPDFYHSIPGQEIDQLLFLTHAKLVRTDVSSVISYKNKLPITSSNRLRGIKKGAKNQIKVREELDFNNFWMHVLEPNLLEVHNKKPVHSVKEIELLHQKFPDNIKQFNVYRENEILGGVTIFETESVAHAQYISANEKGRKVGALDFLFDYLIQYFSYKRYFDFGISTEEGGTKINRGLIHWKESFGGRSFVHRFYEVDPAAHHHLNHLYL